MSDQSRQVNGYMFQVSSKSIHSFGATESPHLAIPITFAISFLTRDAMLVR